MQKSPKKGLQGPAALSPNVRYVLKRRHMAYTIDHFMWGYQSHFRINQKSACERIFQLLDKRFAPQVFLVGILVEQQENRFPACVDPEQDFWAVSSDFDKALHVADGIRNGYKESALMHSHPLTQKLHDDTLVRRSIRDAVEQIIGSHPARPSGLIYFASDPTKVEGYMVSIVLGLQKAILEEHPSLSSSYVPVHEYRDMPVPTSLIDATIKSYLDKASGELRLPDPGCRTSEMNADEILRDGASRMMMGLAYRVDQGCIEGWRGLLGSCTSIARTYYEGTEGSGTIVLAKQDHPSLKKAIVFQNPPRLSSTRAARKLLELAKHELTLHTDSETLFGLVDIGKYDPAAEDLFTIRFLGHHHWEVCHNSQILMRVQYGQPSLPKPPYDEKKLRKDLPRIFAGMTDRQVERIVGLIRQAEREPHGTMLIINSVAKEEATRLATEGTRITSKTLSPELLSNLTPIDGAVLLNPKGTCYAIGVILDGMATEFGNAARGARYNSAIRYVCSNNSPTLAVIVSEDGGVDFFPDLKPRIKRREIDEAIERLQHFMTASSVNRRWYNETMDWLGQHRFYLLQDDCERINQLMESVDKKLEAEDPSAIRIVRNGFTATDGFDPDFYYEYEMRSNNAIDTDEE